MKVIIIGAGSGKRINSKAKATPKCLLKINSKTILENQISLFKKNNIDEIIVITGPHYEKFNIKNLKYVHDSEHYKHDILGSLMVSEDYICDDVLILYSDILFDNSILNQILDSKTDIRIAVDLDWIKAYDGRTEHPTSEAENVLLDENLELIEIRKNIKNNDNGKIGEFLGIMKLSKNGCKLFKKRFNELKKSHSGIFHTAPSLEKAYVTDMIQELIDSKITVKPIFVDGKWCEIDTNQDLQRAKILFPNVLD